MRQATGSDRLPDASTAWTSASPTPAPALVKQPLSSATAVITVVDVVKEWAVGCTTRTRTILFRFGQKVA